MRVPIRYADAGHKMAHMYPTQMLRLVPQRPFQKLPHSWPVADCVLLRQPAAQAYARLLRLLGLQDLPLWDNGPYAWTHGTSERMCWRSTPDDVERRFAERAACPCQDRCGVLGLVGRTMMSTSLLYDPRDDVFD
jgi:hypothetical protein